MAIDDYKFSTRMNRVVTLQPAKTAIQKGKLILNYSQLEKLVSFYCDLLQQLGVGEKSVVGITISEELTHLVVSLSLLNLGATQITIASHDPEPVRRSLCERAAVSHIACVDPRHSLSGTRESILPEVSGIDVDATGFPSAGRKSLSNQPGSLFLHTSGTTSQSNIVPFSERQLGEQAETLLDYANERLFRIASVEHNNSKRHRLYSLFVGGTIILKPDDAYELTDLCNLQNISCVECARIHAADLLANPAKLPPHTKLRIAGSSVPIELRRALEEKICQNLFVRYAATECGVISVASGVSHDLGTVGIPLSRVKVEVVDGNDKVLDNGSVGEIRIRTPGMATGYLDNPQQSELRFRDDWFYPGDQGEILPDGQLIIHGRTDDMLILNSINIFPAHLEKILDQHPAVKESAVCGLDSKVHGQIPVAAVELQPGMEIDTSELLAFAKSQLGLRAPRKVLVVQQIPRNTQGKIVRHEIEELFRN